MTKQKNNAISSVQGITYQNLVALEKCFELLEGQTLYIEIFGDVTVENDSQTEVKHEKGYLDKLSHSFWKTVSNWIDDSKFQTYSKLVLLTTQELKEDSLFKGFNEKTSELKLTVFEVIYNGFLKQKKQSKKTLEYLNNVMSADNRDKLESILDRMILVTEAPSYTDIYKRICQTHASFLPNGKEENYVNSLIGYIHNQIDQSNGEVTYKNFTNKKRKLSGQLMATRLSFPATYVDYEPSEKEKEEALNQPFISKIRDIDYYDSVGNLAVQHFYRQRKTISEEMSGYEPRDYKSYEDNLRNLHQSKYLECLIDLTEDNEVKESKRFYHKVINSSVEPFQNYNDTPLFFRNGYLHELINENDDMVWKLKVDD